MKVRFFDTPAIGWLSFALWLVLLLLAEVAPAFKRGWDFDLVIRELRQDPLEYVFIFLHQLVFALSFANASAEETESDLCRSVSFAFWGVSFAVMLVNALLPLFREELAVTMSAVLVLLFLSGGFYLITRGCRLTGFVICGFGLLVWLVPVFVSILSYPSII